MHAIQAYRKREGEQGMLDPDNGILGDFIRSCSRRVAEYFRNQYIPGTGYEGVEVYTIGVTNDTNGIKRDGNCIRIILNVAESELEMVMRDSMLMKIVLQAQIVLPRSYSIKGTELIDELAWQSYDNYLAVVDGMYIALAAIPIYRMTTPTGDAVVASRLMHADGADTVVTAEYEIPLILARDEKTLTGVSLSIDVGKRRAYI